MDFLLDSFTHFRSSMVVYDLDLEGITACETKAYTPPIIDADAPITFAVAAQSFQSITRRHAKIIKPIGIVKQ